MSCDFGSVTAASRAEGPARMVTGSDYSGQDGWGGGRRKEVERSADRDKADPSEREDVIIRLNDNYGDGDRLGGRGGASRVTGADALAGLMRMTSICWSLAVVLVIGD